MYISKAPNNSKTTLFIRVDEATNEFFLEMQLWFFFEPKYLSLITQL